MTPARTPPDLPGLRPEWSRILFIPDHDGSDIGVHVLEAGSQDPDFTVVCVHGNPTWSYLWRAVIAEAPANVRVIAVDQVGMGYSARSPFPRRLADRVADLEAIVETARVRGRVVLMAHDWGGPIALGLAERLVERSDIDVAALVLTNTAIHQPENSAAPLLISAARLPGVLPAVTIRTPAFVAATTAISSMDRGSAHALRSPYARAADRRSIMEFVADIPLSSSHPSRSTLESIAAGLPTLSQIPTLLVWGMKDPVFSRRYLDDLRHRIPHADVHQYEDAGHLVLEDRPDAIADIWRWVAAKNAREVRSTIPSEEPADLLANLRSLAASGDAAVCEPFGNGWRTISWSRLDDRVLRLSRGLSARGVRAGDRIALLMPPGADLLAVVYAAWSIGAVIVVIDAANGPRALLRALRAARVDHAVAIRRARPVVALLRIPGVVIWADELADISRVQAEEADDGEVSSNADAAVVFTSGATGPAKPVAYTRARIAATRDVLLDHYGFTRSDVLVAAFAPWAVLGPLLGIGSVIPRMDASRPGSLTASALAEAMEQAGGTVMWMSPAALRSVLTGARPGTADRRRLVEASADLRFLLVAGAPVSRRLLHEARELWPHADLRTPYGMTEVLPATDVQASEVIGESASLGVLVGRPLPSVDVAIAALDHDGEPSDELEQVPGVLGEVAIRARHAKSRYDGRAFVELRSSRNAGWHRTGDVGLLDERGRLWIQGRLSHVITAEGGPLGPVPLEQQVEASLVDAGHLDVVAAAVGVGPVGCQVPVIVCAPAVSAGSDSGLHIADREVCDIVRRVLPGVAAVLWRSRMPVDIRHGAKIDRSKLSREAAAFLAGRQ